MIITDFGGFVANQIPAFIDEKTNTVHPLSKGVIFNKNLTTNDGLLANEIARFENTSYEDANDKLNAFVASCVKNLNNGERIEFTNVGVLFFDHQKNIQFIADKNVNFNLNAFGLFPIRLYKLEKEALEVKENIIPITPQFAKKEAIVEEEKKEVTEKETKVIAIQSKKEEEKIVAITPKKRRKGLIAASILIPIGLYTGFVVLKSDVISNGYFQASDLNPFSSNTTIFEPREEIPVFSKAEKEKNFEEVMSELNTENNVVVLKVDEEDKGITVYLAEETNPAVHTRVAKKEINSLQASYQVIGGCFGSKVNADRYVEKLIDLGYDAYILDKKNGLHRVSFGGFETKLKALEALSNVRSENPNAWLLSK